MSEGSADDLHALAVERDALVGAAREVAREMTTISAQQSRLAAQLRGLANEEQRVADAARQIVSRLALHAGGDLDGHLWMILVQPPDWAE